MSNLLQILSAAFSQEEIRNHNSTPPYFQENSQPLLDLSTLLTIPHPLQIDQTDALRLKEICETHFHGKVEILPTAKDVPAYIKSYLENISSVDITLSESLTDSLALFKKNQKGPFKPLSDFFIRFLSDPSLPPRSLHHLLTFTCLIYDHLLGNKTGIGFEKGSTSFFYFRENSTLFRISFDDNLTEALNFFQSFLTNSPGFTNAYSQHFIDFFQLLGRNYPLKDLDHLSVPLSNKESTLIAFYEHLKKHYHFTEYNQYLLLSPSFLNVIYSSLTLILLTEKPMLFTGYGVNQQLYSFYNRSTNFPILSDHREVCAYQMIKASLDLKNGCVEHFALFDGGVELWQLILQNSKQSAGIEELTDFIFQKIPLSRINEGIEKLRHYTQHQFFSSAIFLSALKRLTQTFDVSLEVADKSGQTSTLLGFIFEGWLHLIKKEKSANANLLQLTIELADKAPQEGFAKFASAILDELDNPLINFDYLHAFIKTLICSPPLFSWHDTLLMNLAYRVESSTLARSSSLYNNQNYESLLFEILVRLRKYSYLAVESCLQLGIKASIFQDKKIAHDCCEKLAFFNYPLDKFIEFIHLAQWNPLFSTELDKTQLYDNFQGYFLKQMEGFQAYWLRIDYSSFYICFKLIENKLSSTLVAQISRDVFDYFQELIDNSFFTKVEHFFSKDMHMLDAKQVQRLKKQLIKKNPSIALLDAWIENHLHLAEDAFIFIETIFEKFHPKITKFQANPPANDLALNDIHLYSSLLLRKDLEKLFSTISAQKLYSLFWNLVRHRIETKMDLNIFSDDFWEKFIEVTSRLALESERNCRLLTDQLMAIAKNLPARSIQAKMFDLLKNEILAGLDKCKHLPKQIELLNFLDEHGHLTFRSSDYCERLLCSISHNVTQTAYSDLDIVLKLAAKHRSTINLPKIQLSLETIVQFGKNLQHIPLFMIKALSLMLKPVSLPKIKFQNIIKFLIKENEYEHALKHLENLKDLKSKIIFLKQILQIIEKLPPTTSHLSLLLECFKYKDYKDLRIHFSLLRVKAGQCLHLYMEEGKIAYDLFNLYQTFNLEDGDLLLKICKAYLNKPFSIESGWPILIKWILDHPTFDKKELELFLKEHSLNFFKDAFWTKGLMACLKHHYEHDHRKDLPLFPAESFVELFLVFSELEPPFRDNFLKDYLILQKSAQNKVFFIQASIRLLKDLSQKKQLYYFEQSIKLVEAILKENLNPTFFESHSETLLNFFESFTLLKEFKFYAKQDLNKFLATTEINLSSEAQFYDYYMQRLIHLLKLIWNQHQFIGFKPLMQPLLILSQENFFDELQNKAAYESDIKEMIIRYLDYSISFFSEAIIKDFVEIDCRHSNKNQIASSLVFNLENVKKTLRSFEKYSFVILSILDTYPGKLPSSFLKEHLRLFKLFNQLLINNYEPLLQSEDYLYIFTLFANFVSTSFHKNNLLQSIEYFYELKEQILSFFHLLLDSCQTANEVKKAYAALECFFYFFKTLALPLEKYWLAPRLVEACIEEGLQFCDVHLNHPQPDYRVKAIAKLICQFCKEYALHCEFKLPANYDSKKPYSKLNRIYFFKRMVEKFPGLFDIELLRTKKILDHEYTGEQITKDSSLFCLLKEIYSLLYASRDGKSLAAFLCSDLQSKLEKYFQAEAKELFSKDINESLRVELMGFYICCKIFLFTKPRTQNQSQSLSLQGQDIDKLIFKAFSSIRMSDKDNIIVMPPINYIVREYKKIFKLIDYDPSKTILNNIYIDLILDTFEALNLYRLYFDPKFKLPNEIIFTNLEDLTIEQKLRAIYLRKALKEKHH